jgi:hypothetical protein
MPAKKTKETDELEEKNPLQKNQALKLLKKKLLRKLLLNPL